VVWSFAPGLPTPWGWTACMAAQFAKCLAAFVVVATGFFVGGVVPAVALVVAGAVVLAAPDLAGTDFGGTVFGGSVFGAVVLAEVVGVRPPVGDDVT